MARCGGCRGWDGTGYFEYKKDNHVGHCYAPCPFDIETDIGRVRAMLRDLVYSRSSGSVDLLAYDSADKRFVIQDNDVDTYLNSVLGYSRTTHSGTRVRPFSSDEVHYYMKTQSRGSAWGYECTYDNCPYKINEGGPYFYV